MGWCSATEIMDAVVGAADETVASLVDALATESPAVRDILAERKVIAGPAIDDALRPFVARVARALRDGDWDCIEESDYFDRFRQEMLGYDDDRMADWYREKLSEVDDADRLREYSAALADLLERSG